MLVFSAACQDVNLTENDVYELSGIWYGSDISDRHNHIVIFEKGRLTHYISKEARPSTPQDYYAEQVLWNHDEKDYTLSEESLYSMKGNAIYLLPGNKHKWITEYVTSDKYDRNGQTSLKLHPTVQSDGRDELELVKVMKMMPDNYTTLSYQSDKSSFIIGQEESAVVRVDYDRIQPKFSNWEDVLQSGNAHWECDPGISVNSGEYHILDNTATFYFDIYTSDKTEGTRYARLYFPGAEMLEIPFTFVATGSIVIKNAGEVVNMSYKRADKHLVFEVVGEVDDQDQTFQAYSDVPWLTINNVNSTSVDFSIAENNDGATREGTITVESSNRNVSRAKVKFVQTCEEIEINIDESRFIFSSEGGSYDIDIPVLNKREYGYFDVIKGSDAEWISGIWFDSEYKYLKLRIDENNSGKERSAQLTFEYYYRNDEYYMAKLGATKTVTITQKYDSPEIVLSLNGQELGKNPSVTLSSKAYEYTVINYTIKNQRKELGNKLSSSISGEGDLSKNIVDGEIWLAGGLEVDEDRNWELTLNYGDLASTTITVTQPGVKDLSKAGGANCYIVSKSGPYKFSINYKGNYYESAPYNCTAEVLWESYGTTETPPVGALIVPESLRIENGFLFFKAPDSFNEGNAIVALKNSSGTIVWSWHLWFVQDEIKEHIYANGAGTVMDRNLGATSATPGDVGAFGLIYQWGRKDPFLGSGDLNTYQRAKASKSIPAPVECTASTGTRNYSIQNPTTFIKESSDPSYRHDWIYSSEKTATDRWGENKTMADPCPAGWKVPKGGPDGLWGKAGFDTYEHDYAYSHGRTFSTQVIGDEVAYYPISGVYLGTRTDYMSLIYQGNYWSINNDGYRYEHRVYTFEVAHSGAESDMTLNPIYGVPVRCVKE